MSTDTELRRGERARQIVENEIYTDAIAAVKQGIFDKWASAPMRDREGHHELKLMLKLLGELTSYIQNTMDTGKMAKMQLESERKMTMLRSVGL